MGIMSAERLERVLSMHKDDGVLAGAQEVFCGRGAACAGTEVVQEAHAVSRGSTQSQLWSSAAIVDSDYTLCSKGTVVPPLCNGPFDLEK